MVNILLAESDEKCMNEIKKIISRMSYPINVISAHSAVQAYEQAMTKDISAFIVSVSLDKTKRSDVSGLIFATEMRSTLRYRYTDIILTSDICDSGMYAYSTLHCYAYIEKPLNYKYLKRMIGEVVQKIETAGQKRKIIFFKNAGMLYPLKENEIVYIECHDKNFSVVTRNEVIEINNMSINEISERLPEDRFLRCNRFCFVNRDFIKSIDTANRRVYLKHGRESLEIGRVMKKDFLEKLMKTV